MAAEIEQALYGYSNGHRIIASSLFLPPESGRTLRSVTDMAFDGGGDSYLTSLPLPELRRQAIIRTWPAPEAPRPGSVWSHVLLIDFVDLGAFEHLWPLAQLFRRPEMSANAEVIPAPYEESLEVSTGVDPLPVADLDEQERLRVLWAVYADSAGVVRVADPAKFELLLFQLWAQQWPRLRRSFGFRTRYRVGDTPSSFDLQLVQRLQRDQEEVRLPVELPPWLERIDRDLRRPSPTFRGFLHRFGTESEDGKSDFSRLVEIELVIDRDPDPVAAVGAVGSAFPSPKEMRGLKQALFGSPDDSQPVGLPDEARRLRAVMQARPAATLDLKQLRVRDRLDVLWQKDRGDAVAMVADLSSYEPPNRRAIRILIQTAVEHVGADDVASIAAGDPSLAAALVSQRPDLLDSAAVWRSGKEVVAQLLEMLTEADEEVRRDILVRLLKEGALDAAGELVRQDPAAWWVGLNWGAQALSSGRSLARTASSLGRLLETAGPASIGSAPIDLSDEALTLLALAAAPQVGLWRQASADRWQHVSASLAAIPDEKLRARAMVVLLAATGLAKSAAVRRRLWLAAFGPLLRLLDENVVGKGDLELLDDLLPGPEGQPSARLRKAIIREIKRGNWPPEDVRAAISAAAPHGDSMLRELREKTKRKKSWWREVLDYVAP